MKQTNRGIYTMTKITRKNFPAFFYFIGMMRFYGISKESAHAKATRYAERIGIPAYWIEYGGAEYGTYTQTVYDDGKQSHKFINPKGATYWLT